MTDPKVLKYFGSTNNQLRTFFTGDSDEAKKFKDWIAGLIREGHANSMRHYRIFAAADLAWDAQPILPETIPLMAYAQGKIDVTTCEKELNQLSCADRFIEKKMVGEGEKKDVKPQVNLPRFHEVAVNLGRSYLSRRVDAQMNKYNALRPSMKFEPRTTSLVGKLRGEAMSQYAEIMVDSFGYRHQQRQAILEMLIYSRATMFPACAWERDLQVQFAPENFAGDTVDLNDITLPEGETTKPKLRTVVTREGIPMAIVHPSRVIYDTSYPLATLNTDTGCQWVGFRDLKRYRDVKNDSSYFNTDKISVGSNFAAEFENNRAFFDVVFPGQPINMPKPAAAPDGQATTGNGQPVAVDLAAQNSRDIQKHLYAQNDMDASVFITDIRVKVKPKDWGMGNYPHPVWLRIVVAGDDTPIYAEWLPSLPAIYFGHNEHDGRLVNIGQMHEIMPWQDQLSNIISQLLLVMKKSLLQVILVNTDVIDATTRKKLETELQGLNYYAKAHLLEFSAEKFKDLGITSFDSVMKLVSSDSKDSEFINNAFKAMVQILGIVERLLNLSPQELGQPAPREATAMEIAAIESTTQAKYNAISASVDEGRAAWKKLIYESAMAFGSEEVHLSAPARFTKATIEKAGFKVVDEDAAEEGGKSTKKDGYTIIGTKRNLVHEYLFSSRDGGDRSSNQQAANTYVQLLSSVIPLVGPQAMGKKRIFDLINETFRLVGSYDLKLEMSEEESDNMQDEAMQKIAVLEQELKANAQEVADLTGAVQKLQQLLVEMRTAA
jgi:hypothetical protein